MPKKQIIIDYDEYLELVKNQKGNLEEDLKQVTTDGTEYEIERTFDLLKDRTLTIYSNDILEKMLNLIQPVYRIDSIEIKKEGNKSG